MNCLAKKYCFAFLFLLVLSCSPEKEEVMTTDKIVGNYLTAIGGYENLQKVNSLVKNGNYIEPAYNLVLDAQQLRMRPNYRKVGNLERVDFEEGFDGTAWEYHRGKGLIISEGEAKEAIVVASDFDFPFIDAEKKGYQIKLIGTKEIGGLQAYDISVTMPFENTEYVTNFYFDTNSHLMIAQRKVMPIHAKGEDVDFIVLYSDYKAVNGVLYPFTQIERNEKTGQFLNATIWSEMIPNTNLTLQNFNPPSP